MKKQGVILHTNDLCPTYSQGRDFAVSHVIETHEINLMTPLLETRL